MGRPLPKRFFGNLNTDDTGYNQDTYQRNSAAGFGGNYVSRYTVGNAGSGWTTIPTVTFSGPTLPGGTSVAGTAHYKALSLSTTANGTGYAVGDVLQVDTGTQTTKARAPVAAITVIGTPSITNGGSLYDVTNPSVGDKVTFTHANLSQALRVRVTAVSGSTATSIVVEQVGIWTGSGAAPTSMAGGVGGFTATTSGGPVDNNGAGLVLGFTGSNWGVYSFGAVTVAGDYTAFPSTGGSGTLTSITPATGTGAKADITMGLLSIEITDPGAGYLTAADAAVSFSGSTGAAATAVMSDDSGTPYTADAFPAIIAYGKTTSGGTVQIGDIVRQRGSRRFYFTTADGSYVCSLVAATPAFGEMTITATDSTGCTYYVTKLTRHKALLTRYGGGSYEFADGATVGWTFDAPTTGANVQIENA